MTILLNKKINIITWLVLATACTILLASNTSAAPVVGFEAGRIIDDVVFTNNQSMTVSQIQAFLNSKVPVCDSWGTNGSTSTSRRDYFASKGYPLPLTCLKDYTENGKSSAQIIYDAAQEFSINPQVLIVLLQKEQGLVTDDWPDPTQYRSATGYGCPDTAACDSQYYGFTNQIRWSARMFRAILNDSPTWYTPYEVGSNYVQYSPDPACGGSVINIQNRSTQALYNYTPYQPNTASLNSGYGSGDYCSTYGNRNFYQYFKDWFGSPLFDIHRYDGKPVKWNSPGAGVFKIENGTKRVFPSAEVFLTYFNWPDIIAISNAELENIPLGEDMSYNTTRLEGMPVKGSGIGAGIFKIEDGMKRPFYTAESFMRYFNWDDVIKITNSELDSIPEGLNMDYNVHSRDGNLIKLNVPGAGIFLVENGTKRSFPTANIFMHYFSWDNVITISKLEFDLIPYVGIIDSDVHAHDNKPVKGTGVGAGVYFIANGTKRPFPTAEVFYSYFNWPDVITISNIELLNIPDGDSMSLDSSRLEGKPIKGTGAGAGVFLVENGKKRPFPTAEVFYRYFNWDNVITISNDELNSIVSGDGMQ